MPDRVLPQDLTNEEIAAGFELCSVGTSASGSPILAVAKDVATGLRAVKTQRPDGAIEYAIWDRTSNVPIYFAAGSLAELLRRFPR